MSGEALAWYRKNKRQCATAADVVVLDELAYAHVKGAIPVRVNKSRIARNSGLHRETVIEAIKRLERAQLLSSSGPRHVCLNLTNNFVVTEDGAVARPVETADTLETDGTDDLIGRADNSTVGATDSGVSKQPTESVGRTDTTKKKMKKDGAGASTASSGDGAVPFQSHSKNGAREMSGNDYDRKARRWERARIAASENLPFLNPETGEYINPGRFNEVATANGYTGQLI